MTAARKQALAPMTVIPGLSPGALYLARLSSRSALYGELHQLLEARDQSPPTSEKLRQAIVHDNVLARSSSAARLKLWKELKARYLLDADDPLFSAFWTEWARSNSETERALTAYVAFALNDRLVFDLGVELLYPLLRRAPAELRVADVKAFIERSAKAHPEVMAWSEKTLVAVAQKYAASIRDFGLAQGIMKKTTVRPALYGAPVRLLVRALRLVGTLPLELVQAKAFRVLGLETTEVIDALGEMNRSGALRFRMQADVVELDVGRSA